MLQMITQLSPNVLALSLIIPAVVSSFLAFEALKSRYAPRGRIFAILMFAIALWSIAYAFELASTTKDSMQFWLKVEYLAIPFISLLMLMVVMEYAGLNRRLTAWHIALLLIIPVVTLILAVTHEHHTLYYKQVTLNTDGPFPLLELTIGIWYYVHVFNSYLLVLTGVVLVFQKLYYQRSLFRNQLIFILLSALIPLITFTVYFAGLMPVKNIDPTPFAFAASGVLMSVSIFKFKMLDLLPIAREHIFQSMGDGLVVLDKKLRLVDCNPVANVIFSWKKTPFGKDISELWNEHSDLMQLCRNEDEKTIEFTLNRNDDIYHFLVVSSKIKNHKQLEVGKLIVIHDITHRYKMQQSLQLSESRLRELNAEKDKLFSIIAHDLRGPIGAFESLTEMFVDGDSSEIPDEMQIIVRQMHKSATSLNALLDNLLQWAKMQREDVAMTIKEVDLTGVASRIVDLMHESILSKSLYVKIMIAEDLKVMADENILSTVLRNLLSNAVKFTPKGGSILLMASVAEAEHVIVKVKDTGIGMHPEMIEQLFRLDAKTGRKGTEGEPSTGLGLMICHDFIQRLGSELKVESQVDKGTTFSFQLKIAKKATNQLE